ncbi:sulfur carrier protein ThiS [Hyphomicrobium sp.]|uniref:sulfur carrier protein ThiS n=1 Tax=Hyphomicrobium sp. TaxID=82 RepID=UPI000FB0C8AD|nr:sulfur carrier protein ThiS [Hyphomicrobium sp.]RUO99621.1 MAG: sulfur carrier protein ThiS [Hyphomicrobium sp.]
MVQHEADIEVTVNGRKARSRATTLQALVAEQGFADAKVATALNGEFVSEGRRATTPLNGGDRIEIVTARQGG